MKNTNKKIVAGLAATAIIALSFGSVSAGQGGGQGGLGKVITSEEKAKLQSMNETDKQAYANELKAKYNITTSGKSEGKGEGKKGGKEGKEGHGPEAMLADIEKQEVSAIEIELLEKQYEEEMMSNELYMSFYEMYGIETFKKVAESEAKHMVAVKALLDRYDIEAPTDYNHIKDLYETLKESGSKSAFDALEVGVKIEFVDIDDIITAIKATDNDDIKVVLTNIGGASYNHLRGFIKAIDSNGYETELDWNQYLDESDLSIKGPIKYKLAEKLESEGVELPEQVSSEVMKNKKCDKKDSHDNKGEGKKGEKGENKSQNSTLSNKYKVAIISKYGNVINAMSNDRLEILVEKIDVALEKVNSSSSYSTDLKQKYNLILGALKEITQDKLDNVELDLGELLK
ncbi:MAG: DUF2202 domain-containing protein [Candidatus Gracilibacteria bacterium]|nr:DUF2202 domain-containing protein [Candidatus Gracilibacteria bacterium]MDQ7022210.1 DUF2202 domain-containing protein [Candidatus Gracilibacteria bacterium]